MKNCLPARGLSRLDVLLLSLAVLAGWGGAWGAMAPASSSGTAGVKKSVAKPGKAKRGIKVAKPTPGAPLVVPLAGVASAVTAGESTAPIPREPVVAPVAPAPAPKAPDYVQGYNPRPNPYLANPYQAAPPVPHAPVAPASSPGPATSPQASGGFKPGLPQISLFEQSILPKVQTVYPTGEKPLVVVTFKCPTELVGIDTPSTLILHKVVNGGMDLINKTNLLSFNMQQVCQ